MPKDRQTGQVTSIGRLRDGHSAPRGCHAWHSMACHADVSDHEYAVRSVCKSELSSCATRPPGHAGGTCRGCIKRHRWSILLAISVHFSKSTCLCMLQLSGCAVLSKKDTLRQAPFVRFMMDTLPRARKILPYSRRPFLPFVVEKGKEQEKKKERAPHLRHTNLHLFYSFTFYSSFTPFPPPRLRPLTAAITLPQSYQPFWWHCFFFFIELAEPC